MDSRSLIEASGNVQRIQQHGKAHLDQYPLRQQQKLPQTQRSSTPQYYGYDRSSLQSEAFQFDLDRHLSVNAYDMLSTLSSDDEREAEYTWEPIRAPPSTLPPVPVLPDTFPLPIHDAYMQRSPIILEVTTSTARKVSPISLDNPARQFSAGPSAHQKTASQKYLLPMHTVNPHLTLDKPAAKKDRVVQVHWLLLVSGCFFPPLLFCLAFGVFDEVCYLGPKAGLVGDAGGLAGQIRRIKVAAAVIGTTMLVACLAGFIVGFALA
ncbi:hypothetical protein BCR37DRAFT_391953 [Protomyces lactucae-debilis]|uniref:Uncharacterized protein n=1 Tax=Protomyces lactucae-debilis TaxID=2754530 RepID=A0A1Y2FK67_PROLT|nr:uncharacterized protein BCR37DRAFT_391953 [Protomyces lactucae-debilis]ORY84371.1 hypothetical protein BCR37DRAFT_391953 [Protomyces lactucae-debilis]